MVYVLRANLATGYAMAKMLFTEGILTISKKTD